MLGDPELVILDEPANGLDPEGMREIRHIIKELSGHGKTIFLSSHLLGEVERTCTHVAIIKEGKIVRQASVKEITSETAIAGLRGGENPEALKNFMDVYPGAVSARVEDDTVVVELADSDLSTLNRFVSERGVYLSHLALRQRTLEDVFMEATGGGEGGMGEVA